MPLCQVIQPWEYDEIAQLTWLPQPVRDAFARFSQRTQNALAFKYVHEGSIEGVCIGKFVDNDLGRHLVIGYLNVKDGCRNKGIGSALLNRYIQISAQNQVACRLQVTRSNRKAKRLYSRFDFAPIPCVKDPGTLWMARST